METDNLLIAVAVVAVAFSLIGTAVTYNYVSDYNNFMTGFATESGVVNVTVSTQTAIEIISAGGVAGQKNVTWGSGAVDTSGGNTYAILSTNGTVTGSSTWSAVTGGFIVRNIGNSNVTMAIHSNPTAATFIGGTGPEFKYNISNSEAGSCVTFPVSTENTYKEFTDSPADICTLFLPNTDKDEVRIDVLLKVPSDSLTGTRNSTVVLTYSAV